MQNLRILIVGGYGTFGGRLAQLLADEEWLTLVIAGRSLSKAEDFCRRLPASATLTPNVFDRNGDLESQIKYLSPDVVVDATGPFQNYGEGQYRVVEACIALGVNYLDLSDGSDFVKGISQFDEMAKAKNIFVLSGVSSFPVLTAAVVRELAKDMTQVDSIKGGIAPSPYAGVGENVIRAIAGYAGQPVKLTRGGKKVSGYGLTEIMNYTISPPGRLPLHNTRFSLVDVPDLQVIPGEWLGLESIWMGAGPVPEILHRALNGLAWLVRLKILPSLLPFAKVFYHAINIVRWGEHRGGMFVEVAGIINGQQITRSWHLLAEGNDGPLIPSMAIEAVIRNMLDRKIPVSGARPATNDVPLEEYEKLFKNRTIYTGRRRETSGNGYITLYRNILEDAWQELPKSIQYMHDLNGPQSASGMATVERGQGILAELIAKIFGFPQAGNEVPVTVDFALRDDKEYWKRSFAGKSFTSIQSAGKGAYKNLICERFGLFTFGLAVVVENGKLQLIIRRWNILGLPMPLFLAPGGHSYESEDDGRFNFHVEISLPLIGLIVRYQGWLVKNNNKFPNYS